MRVKEAVAILLFLSFAELATCSETASTRQQQIRQHTLLAQQYLREQKPDLAVPQLQAVVALDPRNVDARGNLGVLLYFRRDYAAAVPQLRAALELQPGLWKIQSLLGLAERRTGQNDRGLHDLAEAFPHLDDPKIKIQVGNELIEDYSSTGDLDSAAATAGALLKVDPTNVNLLYTAYRLHSDLADQAMLTMALVAPGSAQMHQVMAHELNRHDDKAAAIGNYREAIKLDPTLSGLHFELAEMLYNSSDPVLQAQAEAEYKTALLQNPSDAKAESRLGDIAAKRGDLQQAQADYSRALQLSPDDGDIDTSYAKVLLSMNEPAKAQKLLEKAIQIDPSNYVAHYRLSMVYRRQGNPDKARSELAEYQKYKEMKEKLRKIFDQMRVATDKLPTDRDAQDGTDAQK